MNTASPVIGTMYSTLLLFVRKAEIILCVYAVYDLIQRWVWDGIIRTAVYVTRGT